MHHANYLNVPIELKKKRTPKIHSIHINNIYEYMHKIYVNISEKFLLQFQFNSRYSMMLII